MKRKMYSLAEEIGIVFKQGWRQMNEHQQNQIVKALTLKNREDVEHVLDSLEKLK